VITAKDYNVVSGHFEEYKSRNVDCGRLLNASHDTLEAVVFFGAFILPRTSDVGL
jgi:hypothetical protein